MLNFFTSRKSRPFWSSKSMLCEAEIIDHVPHVLGEPVDVGDEVLPDVLGVVQELRKSNLEML